MFFKKCSDTYLNIPKIIHMIFLWDMPEKSGEKDSLLISLATLDIGLPPLNKT